MASKAKNFEARFAEQWLSSVEDTLVYRLYDTTSGYLGIKNVGDFINYKYPEMYIVDCKSHKGNTLPLTAFTQYEAMIRYIGITGVHCGTVIWFEDKDKVVWVPIETWKEIVDSGGKSFNVKDIGKYDCLEIPSTKQRVYMVSDYSALIKYYEEKRHAGNR